MFHIPQFCTGCCMENRQFCRKHYVTEPAERRPLDDLLHFLWAHMANLESPCHPGRRQRGWGAGVRWVCRPSMSELCVCMFREDWGSQRSAYSAHTGSVFYSYVSCVTWRTLGTVPWSSGGKRRKEGTEVWNILNKQQWQQQQKPCKLSYKPDIFWPRRGRRWPSPPHSAHTWSRSHD